MQLQLRESKWSALSQGSLLRGKGKGLEAAHKKLKIYRAESPQVLMKSVIVIISDDSGFAPLLKTAKRKGWLTGIMCSKPQLYKFQDVADVWLPWRY
jgi:hypothetical protein